MTPPRTKAEPTVTTDVVTEELAAVGITVGTVYDDVWHDGTYVSKVKLIAIGTVLGEPVLTFQVEGTKSFYLIRWAEIARLKRTV